MDRIDDLENLLQGMWDAPLSERVALWRGVYQDCPDFARDRMHRLAYDYKLGAATGEEWIHVEDVTELEGNTLPNHPPQCVSASTPYRGYGLHVNVERDSTGSWSGRGKVDDSHWHTIHEYALRELASLEDAFRTAMTIAVKFVDARMKSARPAGIDPAIYILGEESD